MELLLALALFCAVTLFTPGPNNLMLMASGLNFGFRRGMPHLWGVTLGFTAMVLIVGLGLGAIFHKWPVLYTVLKYGGAAYLLYLAWQIAVSPPPARAMPNPQASRSAFCRRWRSNGSTPRRG
jgi:threonine/homoserine/homoserine lactone efflux protein